MEGTLHFSSETPVPITSLDVVRSWKDPRYRRNLSAQQLQELPEHPSGAAMLTDQELKVASGLSFEEEEFAVLTTSRLCTTTTFNHWQACGCP